MFVFQTLQGLKVKRSLDARISEIHGFVVCLKLLKNINFKLEDFQASVIFSWTKNRTTRGLALYQ